METNKVVLVELAGLSLATLVCLGTIPEAHAQGLRNMLQQRMQQEQSYQQQPNQGQSSYQGGQGYSAQEPDVSVVTLQTQTGPNGQQMVVTPKGAVVPLPGQGVNGQSVNIYVGRNGGYWYVDKYNQNVDLTSAVQAFQRMNMSPQSTASVPQYAPPPQYNQPPTQTTTVTNNSGGGSSAGVTAAAAGLGAMTGAMVGNAINGNSGYGNVPYGTPMYYGANGNPYYHSAGKPVYVNNSTTNNVAAVNQQNDAYNYHRNTAQQQNEWYHNQQTQQSENWKNWQQQQTKNPFVRSEYENEQNGAWRGQGQAQGQAQGQGQAARAGQAAQNNQGEQGRRGRRRGAGDDKQDGAADGRAGRRGDDQNGQKRSEGRRNRDGGDREGGRRRAR
jgi:hypothetical protein